MPLNANDRIRIHELVTSYGVHHDRRDFDALRECFTPDATYIMRVEDGATHGPREGADSIVEQINEFKRSQTDVRRHHISNIQVTELDERRAQVDSYVLVSAVEDATLSFKTVGNYTDIVVCVDGDWRIAAKELRLDTSF